MSDASIERDRMRNFFSTTIAKYCDCTSNSCRVINQWVTSLEFFSLSKEMIVQKWYSQVLHLFDNFISLIVAHKQHCAVLNLQFLKKRIFGFSVLLFQDFYDELRLLYLCSPINGIFHPFNIHIYSPHDWISFIVWPTAFHKQNIFRLTLF